MAISSIPDVELELRYRYRSLYIPHPDANHIKFEVSLYNNSTTSKESVSRDYIINLADYSLVEISKSQNHQCSSYLDIVSTIHESYVHHSNELRILNSYVLDYHLRRLSPIVEGALKLECLAKVIYDFFSSFNSSF